MRDPRVEKLASLILNHSVKLKARENLLIELTDSGEELAAALVRQAYDLGANPFLSVIHKRLQREWIAGANLEQLRRQAGYDIPRMKDMDACVSIRGTANSAEFGGVAPERMDAYQREYHKPINIDLRLSGTKWCVLNWPNPVLAKSSGMNTDEFEDFFFQVCCVDYPAFAKQMERLAERMERADRVHILAAGTDLTFSVKGQPAVVSDGINNLPDGEVSCGPIRDSANGYITYNAPSEYMGFQHQNVRFELKDGKIISASSNNSARTNAVLDTDEGARYIGEFAIGLNPYITRPICDTLFDEKATGSIHFTPGNAYANSFNGNRSAVHWDLVQMHTPEFGGGEIWFDNELIRKDGLFVPDYLAGLNPKNLTK